MLVWFGSVRYWNPYGSLGHHKSCAICATDRIGLHEGCMKRTSKLYTNVYARRHDFQVAPYTNVSSDIQVYLRIYKRIFRTSRRGVVCGVWCGVEAAHKTSNNKVVNSTTTTTITLITILSVPDHFQPNQDTLRATQTQGIH
jgi:formate dehydrogenase assembly factor FdhD